MGEDNVPNEAVGKLLALLNGYNYANGNPVNLVDPDGKCPYGYSDVNGNCAPIAIRDGICASRDLHYARSAADPTRAFWDSGLDLWLTQIKAQCLLEGSESSLEKLADLSDFVASAYGNDSRGYMDIMSQVVIGTYAGTGAAVRSLQAGGCAGWGREPKDCPSNTLFLDDTGFHADFKDGHNQVYHFWGMVASTGVMQNLVDFFYTIPLNLIGFQIIHEFVQGIACNKGIGSPFGDTGSSWQDFALTDMAITLGINISLGSRAIWTTEVGKWIRNNLGESGKGWDLTDTPFGRLLGVKNPAELQAKYSLPGGYNAVCGQTTQNPNPCTC